MRLVEHPPSVAIVAVEDAEVVVVRQTRPGTAERTVELPSGKVETGETPGAAAARELAEECGLAAAALGEIGAFWAVPAYSTEYVHVFEATGLEPTVAAPRDDDEDVEVERVSLAEAPARLSDAVSIAALSLWQLRR